MTKRKFTYDDALQILRLVEADATCRSFRLDVGGVALALEREVAAPTAVAAPATAPAPAAGEPVTVAVASSADQRSEQVDDVSEVDGEETLRAPMAGVFYRAAAPGEEPFVSIDSSIERGATIGIVEVMKLMNTVSAPFDGIVTAIFIEDGQPVQFDQPLVRIRPRGYR